MHLYNLTGFKATLYFLAYNYRVDSQFRYVSSQIKDDSFFYTDHDYIIEHFLYYHPFEYEFTIFF